MNKKKEIRELKDRLNINCWNSLSITLNKGKGKEKAISDKEDTSDHKEDNEEVSNTNDDWNYFSNKRWFYC